MYFMASLSFYKGVVFSCQRIVGACRCLSQQTAKEERDTVKLFQIGPETMTAVLLFYSITRHWDIHTASFVLSVCGATRYTEVCMYVCIQEYMHIYTCMCMHILVCVTKKLGPPVKGKSKPLKVKSRVATATPAAAS